MNGELINFKELECAGLACQVVKDRDDLEMPTGISSLFKVPGILEYRMSFEFYFSCNPVK